MHCVWFIIDYKWLDKYELYLLILIIVLYVMQFICMHAYVVYELLACIIFQKPWEGVTFLCTVVTDSYELSYGCSELKVNLPAVQWVFLPMEPSPQPKHELEHSNSLFQTLRIRSLFFLCLS